MMMMTTTSTTPITSALYHDPVGGDVVTCNRKRRSKRIQQRQNTLIILLISCLVLILVNFPVAVVAATTTTTTTTTANNKGQQHQQQEQATTNSHSHIRRQLGPLMDRVRERFSWLPTYTEARIFILQTFFPNRELIIVASNGEPADAYPLQRCQGDCQNNHANCDLGLLCYSGNGRVPGCQSAGATSSEDGDFCHVSTDASQLILYGRNGAPSSQYPLSACQGECTTDDDCVIGLKCFIRQGTEAVPGCNGQGIEGINYCYGTPSSYIPGQLNVFDENGLVLSQGLKSRLIAVAGEPVINARGQASETPYHVLSDGAAIFIDPNSPDPNKPRYKYVANSENSPGGVGAIEFDENGNIVGYERLLSGTSSNCGGGKTFWNTWISCEERSGGQIWEVNPYPQDGQPTSRMTAMGYGSYGYYESAAYDNRNPDYPQFYITTDEFSGPLVRFTPSLEAIAYARSTGDYSQLLHDMSEPSGTANNNNRRRQETAEDWMDNVFAARSGTSSTSRQAENTRTTVEELSPTMATPTSSLTGTPAKYEFMVLNWSNNTYYWTDDLSLGKQSASNYFRYCEGIDIRDGILYMTCKTEKQLYVLDLDAMTFQVSSTVSGAFNSQPDQVARLLDGPGGVQRTEEDEEDPVGDILYFCEDGDTETGVHARDRTGQYFTILAAAVDGLRGETTGLAFSPGNYRMYVSFQHAGRLFEITRQDGKPFGGQRLDIKYHGTETRSTNLEGAPYL